MEGMSHVDDFFGCGWIVGDTERFQRGITLGFTGFNVDRRLVNLDPNCHEPRREQQAVSGTFVMIITPGTAPEDVHGPSRMCPSH